MTAKLTVPGQQARFSFARHLGPSNQTVQVTLAAGSFASDCNDQLLIIGPYDNVIASTAVCDPDDAIVPTTQLADPGTYTVVLTLSGRATGAATLALTRESGG